jgi:HTH-type transcriptional regulator/antitoxin HigA
MNIKPIKNNKDYNKALDRVDELMEAKSGTPDFDELEILSILVEQYEKEHFPIEVPDPIDVLKFYMEQNGLTNKDIEKVIGHKGRVSDVLHKKRPLSITMIRSIAEEYQIPAEILIRKYKTSNNQHHAKQNYRKSAACR